MKAFEKTRKRPSDPTAQNTIELPIELSLADAYTGIEERLIRINCRRPCTLCRGNGNIFAAKCPVCHSQQFIIENKTFSVTIPAGIDSGDHLRIKGEGHLDLDGHRGDLVLIIQVLKDQRFDRKGLDLFTTITITPTIADQGGMVQVPLPDGRVVALLVPCGIEATDSLRILDQGMVEATTSKRGHLYVRVRIAQPAVLQPWPVAEKAMEKEKASLGNYCLLRRLGAGGFAEVYLGEHNYLKTLAAIKVLRDQVNQEEMEQFVREAEMIARLTHPHIVRVLEFGVESGKVPYLVMDYAPGGTLRERHPAGSRVPLTTVVSYVKQVASALQYAHSEKLIHRDIKPENMLITATNAIVLSDFGIAVGVHRTESMQPQDGAGTIAYMAPEQIQGYPRPASDQYALATVAYEWICGCLPFNGESVIALAMRQINDTPIPLRVHVPSLSPAVEQVILKGLAKDPNQRYATMLDFATALEHAVSGRRANDLLL